MVILKFFSRKTPNAIFSDGANKGTQQSMVLAFSRGRFTYFLDSILRPQDPLRESDYTEWKLFSARISRMCENDVSINVDSRIDSAITCGNFG